MTAQLDIYGAIALAESGMAKADATQPLGWKVAVDHTIRQLAATGRPFTSDAVVKVTGDSPTGSQGALGARFRYAARAGVIVRCGYAASARVQGRGRAVALWRGPVLGEAA